MDLIAANQEGVIEGMPVFQPGSLLARFIASPGPGLLITLDKLSFTESYTLTINHLLALFFP